MLEARYGAGSQRAAGTVVVGTVVVGTAADNTAAGLGSCRMAAVSG